MFEVTSDFLLWLNTLSAFWKMMLVVVGVACLLLDRILLVRDLARCGSVPRWLSWWRDWRGHEPSMTQPVSGEDIPRPSYFVFVFGTFLMFFGVLVLGVGLTLLK